MEYNNVLNNPALAGHTIKQEWLKDGNKLYVEWPDGWEWVSNKPAPDTPQLLHNPSGYRIDYGWLTHISSLLQKGVVVEDRRYLAKAVFAVHRGALKPETFKPTDIEWRFEVLGLSYSNGLSINGRLVQPWNSYALFGSEVTCLFPFQVTGKGRLDIYFTMQSNYPSHTCSFELKTITLEEVEAAYGGVNVPFVQPLALPTPIPEPPAPAPDPEPQPPIEVPEPPQPPIDSPPSQWNLPLSDWLALLQIHAHSHRDAAKHHRRLAANHFQTADLIDRMIIKFGGTPEPKEELNNEFQPK